MKPEDVPTDLVEKAYQAYLDDYAEGVEDSMPAILAAVLPEIQVQAWDEGYGVGYEDQRYRGTTRPYPENPYAARLTARDHCDSGCINPGSGDCPTCKAAANK